MPSTAVNGIDEYFSRVGRQLTQVVEDQRDNLAHFADLWAQSIREDKLLYAFGSGHSRFIAGELYWRAGGLAPVVVIDDPSNGAAERLEGYAGTFLDHYDLKTGDLVVVISNSGINPVPIEVATGAREKGATVVALTSRAHSNSVTPRRSAGKRLHEIADLVIDTGIPAGDALVEMQDSRLRAGPASTVISTALLNAVVVQTAQNLLAAGIEPPVLVSANVAVGDQHNQELAARYWPRLTKFPRLGLI